MPYLKYKRRARRRPVAIRGAVRAGRRAGAMNRKVKMASLDQVARQVKTIRTKMRRDVEVKEYTPAKDNLGDLLFGQVDGNNSGTDIELLDLCTIGQGTNLQERVGNKVKLIGIALRFYVQQLTTAGVGTNLIFDIWKTNEMGYSLTTIQDLLYDVDGISGVRDGHSSRNQDWIKSKKNPNGLFQLVASKRVYMGHDNFSTQTRHKDFKMFIKRSEMLHYNGSAAQAPANVRYIVVARATTGNRSSTTTSTSTGVPITSINTGFSCRWRHTSYYTDE